MTAIVNVAWGGGTLSSAGVFPVVGETPIEIPVGAVGSYDAWGSGFMEGLTGWANPDDIDDPPPQALSLTISRNEGGNILAGEARGEVGLLEEETRRVQFSMIFTIEADPMWSTPTQRTCRLDG